MLVFREWVDAGGLLCYGPSITALFARVAEFVDRIARGAVPSDLPIEQPTKFEMVVNLKHRQSNRCRSADGDFVARRRGD